MKIEREESYQPSRHGLWLLQGLIAVLFIILCSRFWYLQILHGNEFASRAEANRTREEKIFASRGMIFDRNHNKLAIDNITFDLTIIREDCPDIEKTLAFLATILAVDKDELNKTFNDFRSKRTSYEPTLVLDNINFEQVAKVESFISMLPGVYIHTNARRFYPEGEAFAHVLGYVAESTKDDMEKISALDVGDTVGRQGLEFVFEERLRGIKGEYKNQRDVSGKVLAKELQNPPRAGEDLILAFDLDLQHAIIDIMGEQQGSVIVMEPHTGEVHALVTLPSYDNNLFVKGLSYAEWDNLSTNIYSPLQNRSIQSMYPPGSIWKIMMASLFLTEGIDPKDEVYCGGAFTYGNNTFRCWRDHGHGSVNMEEAIADSCDVYFYEKGVEIGIDRISEYAKASGFGKRTGIDIPNEKEGLVPSKEWKLRRWNEPWQGGETVNVSIGQGQTLVTPLQIATYISTIVNGGKILKPQVLSTEKAEVLSLSPTSLEHIEIIKEYMITTATTGTAKILSSINPGITIGGKTGTAQVVKLKFDGKRRLDADEIAYLERDHGWIASFTQYNGRDFVVIAMIEHGGGGSSAAGPVVRDVINYLYKDVLEKELVADKEQ